MIAFDASNSTDTPAWHAGFLALLPAIYDQVRFAFRGLAPDRREEAIHESLARAMVAYVGLFNQGRASIAYPTPLARFAVRQVRAGRSVGNHLNVNDISSRHCQQQHGLVVERLDRRDSNDQWKEILVEDRRSTPAETATARIDFADWLDRLTGRSRQIATTLATGEGTKETARKFQLTMGRISQMRGDFKRSWERFQGEAAGEAGELAMAGC